MRLSALVAAAITLLMACPAFVHATPALPAPEARLESYLGSLEGYDRSVVRPSTVLGFEPGEWHMRHDQVLSVMRALEGSSKRMKLFEYGRTFTGRPLVAAVFGSPARLRDLEAVRTAHLKATAPGAKPADRPVVVWLGYGVHGNEPSATNGAVVTAYWLAASPEAGRLLENSVVILDPCLNPEGFERFANWANAHRGSQLVADPEHREHREPWPAGRFNHFLFDLNRDYLPLAQQESRARLAFYWSWNPDLMADWHEMGPSSSYFFQPGHPARGHPARPADIDALTTRIAEHHAKALGALGSLYYTRDRFDDFYVGKGSTYPDVTGAIGILYEQASSRGHVQESSNGTLTFPFTIRNQIATSQSTLRAAVDLRRELTARRVPFLDAAKDEAAADGIAGWMFASPEDPERSRLLASLLRAHGAEVSPVAEGGWWVPAGQPRHRFLRSILEERTQYPDTTFYDISAWNAAHAYGAKLALVKTGETLPQLAQAEPAAPGARDVGEAYAWLVDWRDHGAGPLLQRLLAAGVHVRAALRPLRTAAEPDREWPAGTLIIPAGLQKDVAVARRILSAAAGVRIGSADSRMSVTGPDLGGDDIPGLRPRTVALLVGEGVDTSDAGEVWFTLDQRIGLPVTLLETSRVARARLSAYTTLILANGTYSSLSDASVEALKRWIDAGGTLVALGGAAKWAVEKELLRVSLRDEPALPKEPTPTYGNLEEARAVHRIAGAIFRATADLTHPMAFGLGRTEISLFQDNAHVLTFPKDLRSSVLSFGPDPVVAGYVSHENALRFARHPAMIAQRSGSGAVIATPTSPVFRAYFHGTEKLLLNAIYFAPLLRGESAAPAGDDEVD